MLPKVPKTKKPCANGCVEMASKDNRSASLHIGGAE